MSQKPKAGNLEVSVSVAADAATHVCVCVCVCEREEMCVIAVGEEKEGHTLVTTSLLLEHLYRIVIFHLQL